MPRIQRVLCPSDFSEPSAHALAHAIVIAKWYGASILAVHAHNPLLVPVPGLALAGYRDIVNADAPEARQLHDELASWFQPAVDAGVSVDVRLDSGPPAAVILDAARSAGADLIVMGTHGLSGFEYPLLGSVTEKVVRKARGPVMTVPPRAQATSKLPFKRLLCATDFSEPAEAAVELAFSLAREGDAALTLVHVVEWGQGELPTINAGFDVPEYKRLREQAALRQLEQFVPADARAWCTPTLRLCHGKAYTEILGVAAEDHADLIVLGVQGRNALDILLFGSTANQLVRHATCPVLTVRR